MTELLCVDDLAVSYGGIEAVRGIALRVAAGEKVALIGANGAGKSTTLKALAGLVRSTGSVALEGRDLAGVPPHARVGAGLVLVPEGRGIFKRLTVEENLQMGAYTRRDDIAADLARVYAWFPRLAERREQLAGTLSGGEQQMVAIGRAVIARPKVLLLDEPSMGLAPLMVQKVFEVIRAIADSGVTLLLVEQNARLALSLCERGYVMESGRIAVADTAKNLLANPDVQRAYLGG